MSLEVRGAVIGARKVREIFARFPVAAAEKLSALGKGTRRRIRGKLVEIQAGSVTLKDCTLVDASVGR